MIFYKFQKADELQFAMLQRGEIFFASPAELNDSSECRPRLVFNGSTDLWRRLAEFLLTESCVYSGEVPTNELGLVKKIITLSDAAGHALKNKVRSRDLEIGHLGDQFAEVVEPLLSVVVGATKSRSMIDWIRSFIDKHLPELLKEERYIASFCLSATNPTMWGHYANAERGFAVVYTTVDEKISVTSPLSIFSGTRPSEKSPGILEIGRYKDDRLPLARVEYATKLPTVNAFIRLIPKLHYSEEEHHYDVPLLLPAEAGKKQESKIGLLKYSEWRYEKEIRAFFPTYDRLVPDVRIVSVATENIVGVIFGANMTRERMVRTIVCCHLLRQRSSVTSAQPFMFFQAKRSTERFRLTIEPEGLLGGSYSSGHIPIRRMKDLSAEEVHAIRAVGQNIAVS